MRPFSNSLKSWFEWLTAWFGGGGTAAFLLHSPSFAWVLMGLSVLNLSGAIRESFREGWNSKSQRKMRESHKIACDFCRNRNFEDPYPPHQHVAGSA
jgi:hypothetical protein